MLTLAVACIALQGRPPIQPPLTALGKKLTAYAEARGWQKTIWGTDYKGNAAVDPHFVRLRLHGGTKAINVTVDPATSKADAIHELKTLRSDLQPGERRTEIEESGLKGTGLSVDVVDFSNKRISNMKTYALTGGSMRVSGRVKNTVVWITVDTPQAVLGKVKNDNEVYDDIVSFATFLAHELKK
jgi:hypothetical protein